MLLAILGAEKLVILAFEPQHTNLDLGKTVITDLKPSYAWEPSVYSKETVVEFHGGIDEILHFFLIN